jgi:hypothetical protein
MTIQILDSLIDKQDSFEIVRDQIAGILAAEVANQMAKATAAGKDPELWKVRVFVERSQPFEQFIGSNGPPTDKSPICNVYYDSGTFPGDKSNTVSRQLHEAVYQLDVYGYGVSSDDPDNENGHIAGDSKAAKEAQRAVRLVRNILMASINTYLQMQGEVWGRMPQSITMFQPKMGETPVQNVIGARLTLAVKFSEFSPQIATETLESMAIEIKRKETGEVYVDVEFEYPGST